METKPTSKERQAIFLYLIVANLWTWVLWIPTVLAAIRQGLVLPSPDNYARIAAEGFSGGQHVTLAVIFSLAVYGPLIGACIALAYEHGSKGVNGLLANTFDARIPPRWYLIALLIATAIAFVPAILAWLTGSLGQPLLVFGRIALLFLPVLILQLLTSGLGEEPGWRGYLLPRLQKRFTTGRTIWLLGFIWAVWHYPLTTIYVAQGVPDGVPAIGAIIAVLIGLISQTIGVIGITYIYVWLFNRTASIFLMIVFHALTNTLPFLIPAIQGPLALLVGIFPWVIVLTLRLILGKNEFPGQPATSARRSELLEPQRV
jgi:membrane protease YdiL (CAAX protease family)